MVPKSFSFARFIYPSAARSQEAFSCGRRGPTAPLARSDVLPCWQRQPFCRWQKRQTSVLVTERGGSNPLTRSRGSSPKGRAFFVHAPLSASCHEYVSLVGADVLDSPRYATPNMAATLPFQGRGGACSSRFMFAPHDMATRHVRTLEASLREGGGIFARK